MTSPDKSKIPTEIQGESGELEDPKISMAHRIIMPIMSPPWNPSIKSPTYWTKSVIRPKRTPALTAIRVLAHMGRISSSKQIR